MKRAILTCSLFAAILAATAGSSVLSLKESIKDSAIIYPESFETDTQELLDNWYLQNYTVIDQSGAELPDVPTTDADYIERLKKLPTVIEMPYNSVVRNYIDMYTQRRRQLVEEMLRLSLYYTPIFEQALEKEGLPLELKYLPVIESALDPNAVSRAGATGLWQFMLRTAKSLGLEVNSLVDERRDPIRSSEIAAKYLKQLYEIYGNWSLAIASYNCGPGNVNKALRRAGGENKDFWDIYFYLPAETRGYVPAFIAANYVMTYYADHDLGRSLAIRPITTDTVHVNHRVHFNQIASVLDIPIEEIRVLNPQYRKDEIPGDIHPYALTLPSQQIYSYIVSEDSIIARDAALYARRTVVEPNDGTTTTIDGDTQLTVIRHKVKSGETLSKIARHYGVSTASIKKWNNLRSNRILRGQQLKIHVYEKVSRKEEPEEETATTETTTTPAVAQAETPEAASVETQETASVETPAEAPEKNQPENPTYHTVSRGETLGSIADDYRVSLSDLREWNNISGNTIYAGQRLLVDGTHAPKTRRTATSVHTVRSGENLSIIAERYGVTVANLREWNNLTSDRLNVGDKLSINGAASSSPASSEKATNHKVRRGETLSSIAGRYGVTVADLQRWNNLSGTAIDAGQTLTVSGDKKTSGKQSGNKTYKVKSGDTLGGIAEKYGTTAAAIRRANGIKGSTIRVGQTLIIP